MRTLTIATLLSLALPAQAHTRDELDAYFADWNADVAEAGGVTTDLLAEHSDMRVRHSWYWAPPPPVTRPANRHATTRPGVYRGMGSNVEQWRGLVAAYFGAETERALCVVAWESGGNPNAASPTNDHGLFQIHAPLWTDHYGVSISQLYDPETNTRLAKSIRDSGGWGMWSAVKRGKC